MNIFQRGGQKIRFVSRMGRPKAYASQIWWVLSSDADTAANTFRGDEERNERFSDHVEVLSKAAQGYVHVLKGLGKHVHGNAVVTVILEKLDCGLREGFIVAAVELYASFIYNHLTILYHVYAYILTGVQAEGSGNGDVGPDGIYESVHSPMVE